MTPTEQSRPFQSLDPSPDAERALREHGVVRDADRAGYPHVLVKVPELESALQADVGVEVSRNPDGVISLSVLVYDIPSEPVSYELRFSPADRSDVQYLRGFLDAGRFRLHPCAFDGSRWLLGPAQTFEVPTDVLLRLRHYVNEGAAALDKPPAPPPPEADDPRPGLPRSLDPRDTVIRKLKEQVQALRDQIQDRDKRIIELEDEIREIRSKGRPYKLSGDKKPWWKPFS